MHRISVKSRECRPRDGSNAHFTYVLGNKRCIIKYSFELRLGKVNYNDNGIESKLLFKLTSVGSAIQGESKLMANL